MRLAPLGHGRREVRIVPSPNQLDWNIQRLERRQMFGVSGMFIEEFRGQLHEGGTGARLDDEVVADQRTDERAEMGLCASGKESKNFFCCHLSSQPNCSGLWAIAMARDCMLRVAKSVIISGQTTVESSL